MFKDYLKTSIFLSSLVLASTAALAAPKVKNAILDVSTTDEIVVIADDGETFNRLQTSDITFSGYIGASMKRGRAHSYAVYAGVCNEVLCGTSAFKNLTLELNQASGKDLSAENVSFTFSTDKFPQGLSNNVEAAKIFSACNSRRNSNNPSATFTHNLRLTLGILGVPYTPVSGFESSYGDLVYSNSYSLPVTIRCLTLSMAEAAPQPFFFQTFVKKLGPALTCPRRIEVRTVIRYRKPATAKFRYYHNGKQGRLITINARRINGNPSHGIESHYLVERVKYYNVNPGQHSFRNGLRGFGLSIPSTVKVACKPFKPTAMWMTLSQQKKASCPKNVKAKIRITANRPGSVLTKIKNQAGVVMAIESIKVKRVGNQYIGRLTKTFKMNEIDTQLIAESSNDSALNSGWQPLKVTCLKPVKGTLSYQGADIARCPRTVKVAFSIRTSINGRFKYRVDCTGGRAWAGKVKAKKTGPNTYLAVGVKSFSIMKHEKVSCALKSIVGGKQKILTVAGHSFSCQQGASDDLTVTPDPVSDEPKRPSGFVADPVKCKANERRVRGRCVRIVIDCKRGFQLVNGRCVKQPIVCKRNERLVRGKCVRIVIDCKRGFKLVNGRCAKLPVKCKRNERLVRGKCIQRPISIVCKKGFVRRGKKCVKTPGQVIKCMAGERRVGKRCVCKPSFKRVRGRCVKPAQRVKPKAKTMKRKNQILKRKVRPKKRKAKRKN